MELTYQVPVGDVDTPPSWGLAQGMTTNTEGITGSDWVVASPVSVTAGIATFVFTYAGDPIAQYQTRQPNLWVEAAANQVGAAAIATVTAMHLNGDVSSDVAAGVAVLIVDDPIP